MAAPDDTLSVVALAAEPAARRPPGQRRWLGLMASGILPLFASGDIWLRRANRGFEDMRAYWDAALRVREGLPSLAGPMTPTRMVSFAAPLVRLGRDTSPETD